MGWTKKEISYLKANYETNSDMKEISEKLNKTIRAIQHKGKRIGLSRPRFKKGFSEAQPQREINQRFYKKHKKDLYLKKKKRIKKIRKEMIDLLGGKCSKCNYNKCDQALDFHHNKGEKEGHLSTLIKNSSKEKVLKEIKKCILLCANCHREVHSTG